MKQAYAILLLLLVYGRLNAQEIERPERPRKPSPAYYQQRMTQRYLMGGIALVGGTVLYLVGANQVNHTSDLESGLGGALIAGTGLVIGGGSIPLFISAIHYNRKFNQVSAGVSLQSSSALRQAMVCSRPYPALSIRVRL
jgi:hypothetical protein